MNRRLTGTLPVTWLQRASGFSVVETAIALTAASLLTAAAMPSLSGYVTQARQVRAEHDVRSIALSLLRMTDDVPGEARIPRGWATYHLLVTSGIAPERGPGGAAEWVVPAGDPGVGNLTDHLLRNGPGYAAVGASPTPRLGWRGPYLDAAIGPDPWGHRYAVNVVMLAAHGPLDTIVICAGPNGLIETAFDQDGLVAGGDDIVALVSSGG
jgi:type II secretory pathway pseudopilin PulG